MRIIGTVFLAMNVTTIQGNVGGQFSSSQIGSQIHEERSVLGCSGSGYFNSNQLPKTAVGSKAERGIWTWSHQLRHVSSIGDAYTLTGAGKGVEIRRPYGDRV